MRRVVAVAILIAVVVAGLAAPVMVGLLSWDSSPALRKDQQVLWFWITLPIAAIAALLGVWIGTLTASDVRPLPGWRAAKWGALLGIGLCVVLLPLGALAVLLAPAAILAASSSGAVTGYLLRKGSA